MPSFITATGPTLEARFPYFFNTNGSVNLNSPNGGVETLFTVTGRSDAGACTSATALPQPSFATAVSENNIIFRIPTPVFGAGLIENLDDSTLLNNQVNNLNNNVGVSGTFNHNGNDGTISRFGWKAQNKSLHIFAGEAYNVEMGIRDVYKRQSLRSRRASPVSCSASSMAPQKAEWWSRSRANWVCPCDLLEWVRRWAICCRSIQKNL